MLNPVAVSVAVEWAAVAIPPPYFAEFPRNVVLLLKWSFAEWYSYNAPPSSVSFKGSAAKYVDDALKWHNAISPSGSWITNKPEAVDIEEVNDAPSE